MRELQAKREEPLGPKSTARRGFFGTDLVNVPFKG
jgi:hypothetical protein